jgi:fatty acyl-CoA reductase
MEEFYRGRCLLLTGASGFIGKQILEKLLRSCPDVEAIYVLLRSNKHQTSAGRMKHILSTTLFDRLREENEGDISALEEKIRVVPADISRPDLGISNADKQRIIQDVSVVFHLAATVSFNEPMRVAVNLNILALRRVLELCKTIPKLDAFVHVSTAYANCNLPRIEEKVYPPPLSPTQILDASEWMTDSMFDDITARVIVPRPNTYTFTKSIAEQLLMNERGEIPTAIFRPSIVTATVREPIPGWIDNLNGCTGVLTAIGSGLLKAMYGVKSKTADLVPVDLVANCILATGWYTAANKDSRKDVIVYNFTSGHLKPSLNWDYVGKKCSECFRLHPLENHTWIPKGYVTTSRLKALYSLYIEVYVRMVGIDLVRRLLGKKPRMLRIHRSVRKMSSLMEYFTSHGWTWDTNNVAMLHEALSDHDKQTFNFDVRTIHWSTYFDNYCLGIREHLMHQKMSSLPSARRLLRCLQMVRRFAFAALFAFVARLLISRAETATRLWRFMMSMVTSVMQLLPRAVRA